MIWGLQLLQGYLYGGYKMFILFLSDTKTKESNPYM